QRRFRLPPSARTDAELEIPLRALGELFDAAARELGDGALGIHLAESVLPSRYGLAELAARACATLGEALERLGRYAALRASGAWGGGGGGAGEGGDPAGARLTQRFAGHPRGVSAHLDQWALAQVLVQARALTGALLAPRSVWFIHARVRELEPLRAFFRTGA